MLNRFLSLKLKLLLVLVPGAVIALLVTLGLMLYHAEQQFDQKLEHKKMTLGSYAELLADPLWNFNTERVENILDAMMLDSDIVRIIIRDEGGNLVTEKFSSEHALSRVVSGEIAFPIKYSNAHIIQKVGEVEIALGYQSLESDKAQYILSGIYSLLLVLAALALGVWVVFAHVLGAPLKALVDAIKESKKSDSFTRVSRLTNDELGMISSAFNEMQESLESDHYRILQAKEHLQLLYHSTPSLLFSFDSKGVIQNTSDYFLEQLGFQREEVVGSALSQLVTMEQKEQLIEQALELLWEKKTLSEFPLSLLNGYGQTIEVQMDATLTAGDSFPGALAVITDVTSLNQARRKLEYQANTDHLSGIANRFYFQTYLEQLAQDRRQTQKPFALLFIDLDHFKAINDIYGHDIGDQLLRLATERIKTALRPEDFIARLGGDEFAVILKELSSEISAEHVAERIIRQLELAFTLDESNVFVSASIGIAIYPNDCQSPAELLQYADTAMYRAKEEGRSRLAAYSDEHNRLIQERLKIEALLRRSIEDGLLEIYYQPIINVSTQKIIGIEALLRLRDDNGELISPVDFIPLAEETGRIIQIGEWCIKQACQQLAEWHKQFDSELYLSVNVSTRQFQAHSFYTSLENAINEAGIQAECLMIEITESLLLHDNQNNLSLFKQLKALGCEIAIDDFGTGYSSLSYLMKFPLSVLKIDRSFISSGDDDGLRHRLVEAIIQMSQSMELKVIAEGVETQEQLEVLNTLSEDIAVQGFLISKPLPASEFSLFMETYNQRKPNLSH